LTSLTPSAILKIEAKYGKNYVGARKMRQVKGLPVKRGSTVCVFDLADFPAGDKLQTSIGEKGPIDLHTVEEGINVLAYSEITGKVEWAPVKFWSKHYNREIEIVTLSSRRQLITDDDPRAVYGMDPTTFEMTRTTPSEAMQKRIVVPRASKLHIEESIDKIHTELYMEKSSGKGRALKAIVELNESFGYMLGALCGDGWTSVVKGVVRGQINLCGQDISIFEKTASAIASLFEGEAPVAGVREFAATERGRYGAVTRWCWSSIELSTMVHSLLGHTAREKHLPPFFLTAPESFRKGLFAGLMDTDGTIALVKAKRKKNPQAQAAFCTTSLRMANEIRLLAMSVGVRANVCAFKYRKSNAAWQIVFSVADMANVWKFEGMTCQRKLDRIKDAPVGVESNISARYDLVPFPVSSVKKLTRRLYQLAGCVDINKVKTVADPAANTLMLTMMKARHDGYCSRQSALRVIDLCPEEISHDPVLLKWRDIVSEKSITWDYITNVEKTGIKETGYDLTVPGAETFMSADGVILSNTSTIHVPASNEAVQETIDKLMPSKNLVGARDFKLMYKPTQEYIHALWHATRQPARKPAAKFETEADAITAWRKGELGINDPVRIEKRTIR
jgi:hypothetical protein